MLPRQSKLIKILQSELENYKSFTNKYQQTKSLKESNNELLLRIKEDINNLIEVEDKELASIIEAFDLNALEKKLLTNNLLITKKILSMNKEEGLNIHLEESQKQSITTFLSHIETLNLIRERTIPIDEPEYNDTLSKIRNIEDIISRLEDKNNNTRIIDIETIKEVLNKSHLEEKDIRKILFSLMKYNQEIYLEKKKDLLIEEYIGEPLNIDEVKEIFRKFNYNYDLLSEKVSSAILRYGELKNITEVLDCLKGFKYPKLDEETQGNIIFALVVGSSFETINNITINASNRGLTPEDLIEIPTVLVRQSNEETLYRKKKQSDEHPVSIPLNEIRKDVNILVDNEIAFELLKGRSSDFLSNIEYLEDNGFDIRYIFDKCKQVLTLENNLLKTNISLYEKYGLPIDCNRDKITNQTFSALLSKNLAEIADQFIEIHPLGYKYIKDNISCLKEYSDPQDIVFYNIYESQKPVKTSTGKYRITNAFKEIRSNNKVIIQLCDEVTRKNKKYAQIPFRGITESNKAEKSDTYIPRFKEQSAYNKITKNTNIDINDQIFEKKYISYLNKYTDKNNALCYNFEGIRISKLKVLRIYDLLLSNGINESTDSILYAITYKSIINERSFNKLANIVSKIEEEIK